jgi:hypothetical protein
MKKKHYYLISSFLMLALFGCKDNRSFSTESEFKNWISNKTFESDGKDRTLYGLDGSSSEPVGTLVLKFEGDRLIFQSCNAESYDVSENSEGGGYQVNFKKCGTGDIFTLVVPKEDECYMKSVDFNTSNMSENTSGVGHLNDILSRKEANGPTMKILN